MLYFFNEITILLFSLSIRVVSEVTITITVLFFYELLQRAIAIKYYIFCTFSIIRHQFIFFGKINGVHSLVYTPES